jgi:hypothetical protein
MLYARVGRRVEELSPDYIELLEDQLQSTLSKIMLVGKKLIPYDYKPSDRSEISELFKDWHLEQKL